MIHKNQSSTQSLLLFGRYENERKKKGYSHDQIKESGEEITDKNERWIVIDGRNCRQAKSQTKMKSQMNEIGEENDEIKEEKHPVMNQRRKMDEI